MACFKIIQMLQLALWCRLRLGYAAFTNLRAMKNPVYALRVRSSFGVLLTTQAETQKGTVVCSLDDVAGYGKFLVVPFTSGAGCRLVTFWLRCDVLSRQLHGQTSIRIPT